LSVNQSIGKDAAQAKLKKLAKEKTNIIEAIKQGIPASEVKDDLQRITDDREDTEAVLKSMKETPMVIEPEMTGRYQDAITDLQAALKNNENNFGAVRRFIPTDVGNSFLNRTTTPLTTVHPHGRGELTQDQYHYLFLSGLSPRTWGTR
jgi:hypothetical protein